MSPEQAEACWEGSWCSLWEEARGSEGGGKLGKREAGPSCGQEAGEEGGEAWDVPPQLGGGGLRLRGSVIVGGPGPVKLWETGPQAQWW